VRKISAANTLVKGRFRRIASRSSAATAARASANGRPMRVAIYPISC